MLDKSGMDANRTLVMSMSTPLNANTKGAGVVDDVERAAGWKGGDAMKAKFDNALLSKNKDVIKEMLPDVPPYYKSRFADEIKNVVGKMPKQSIEKEFMAIRKAVDETPIDELVEQMIKQGTLNYGQGGTLSPMKAKAFNEESVRLLNEMLRNVN
jgi:hypothetical protein